MVGNSYYYAPDYSLYPCLVCLASVISLSLQNPALHCICELLSFVLVSNVLVYGFDLVSLR